MAAEKYPPLQDRRAPTLFQRKAGNGAGQWRVRYRHAGETQTLPLGLATAVTEGQPPKDVRDRFQRAFVLPYLQGTYSPWEREEQASAHGAPLGDAARSFLTRHSSLTLLPPSAPRGASPRAGSGCRGARGRSGGPGA